MRSEYWEKLAEFFVAILKLGKDTGFTHNDMHLRNLLYDHDKECFVLIDYGRVVFAKMNAQIYKCVKDIYSCMAEIADNINTNVGQVIKSYGISSQFRDHSHLFVLNDIGSVCMTIVNYIGTTEPGIVIKIRSSVAEAYKSGKSVLEQWRTDPRLYTLWLGCAWFRKINHDLKTKYSHLLQFNINPCEWYLVDPSIFQNKTDTKLCSIINDSFITTNTKVNDWLFAFNTVYPPKQKPVGGMAETENETEDEIDEQLIRTHFPPKICTVMHEDIRKMLEGPDESEPDLKTETKTEGGKHNKPSFKVQTEKQTKRKYVMKSRAKWYLDEHRGQYRYLASADASEITLCGAAAAHAAGR